MGRASRARTLAEIAALEPVEDNDLSAKVTTGALNTSPATTDEGAEPGPTVGDLAEGEAPDLDQQVGSTEDVPAIGEEDTAELSAEPLFDFTTADRIVIL